MYEPQAELVVEPEINDHFSNDKKKELIAVARQRVTELKQELKDKVESERAPLDTVIQPLLDELLDPETQYALSRIENIDDLTANLITGDTESLQRFLDALELADTDQKLLSLRGKVEEALKFRETSESAREQSQQIKKDRIHELSESLDTETVDEIDEYVIRQVEKALLEDHQLSDEQLTQMIEDIISRKVEIDENILEEPEKTQIEQLSASLIELNYPEKMRSIEELREKLLGSETRAELEKFNIELNVQSKSLIEVIEPLLFQLRRIFAPDKFVDQNLEEPYKTLHKQYKLLEEFAEIAKNLPLNIEASYTTRKAIFDAIGRTNNFGELQSVLKDNQEIILTMKFDFEMAGKMFESDLIHEVKSIAELLRDTGNADEYNWSKLPVFLADKIKELSPQFVVETRARLDEQKAKKALEFAAVLNSSANILWLQKGLLKLGSLVPEDSTDDCEELSIIIEAFWIKVLFSEPGEEVEKLVPEELNFPPLNAKLVDLLKSHPAYVELIKIKAGEYNNNLDALINSLKKVDSKYVLSSTGGITAGRMALILNNLKANWAINVNVPRNIAGIGLGKRRLSKEEIEDNMSQGSLSFLDEEKNQFILTAIVDALDKEGRV